MTIRWCRALLAGAAGLAMATGAARAELVANGGFEAGLDGWTTTGFQLQGYDHGVGDVARSGSQAFYGGGVGDAGFLVQSLATVPGQTYRLSFWLFSDGFVPNELTLQIGGSPAYAAADVLLQPFDEVRLDFTAASTSTQMRFGMRNDSGVFRLDDVSVVAVPEPATAVLAGLGLVVVTVLGRRRRARIA